MADQPAQNFQNHTKYDPPFHFVLVPIFLFNLLARITELVRHLINGDTAGWMQLTGGIVIAFGLLLLVFKTRIYSLKVQDRVIRLEERLRLASVLPEPMRARIPELTVSQLVALRFAPDEELTELVRTTLEKKLAAKDIKQGIRNWRPDHFRA
jgi:Family of unknown function (DUF6526)